LSSGEKPIITLVGSRQAKVGFVFLHEGAAKTCEDCRYRRVCIDNLTPGQIYKIVKLRDKSLPCPLHDENVRVVEVQQAEIEAAIESRLAFPDGIITFKPQNCDRDNCPNRHLCLPSLLGGAVRCKVVEVKQPIDCPLSRSLVLALLLRV